MLSFAAQPVSSPSSAQTVTLSNAGPGILLINSVATSGDFSLGSNSCIGTIAVSGSCTFTVTFTPSAVGARTGSILVNSNALGTNSLAISGSGADFAVSGAPNSASVAAGASAAYTISVPSSGASFSNAISLSCGGLPANTVCTFSPSSVNADATSTLTIRTKAAQNAALGSRDSGYQYAIGLWPSSLGLVGCMFVIPTRKKVRGGTKYALRALVLGSLISLCACGGVSRNRTNDMIPGTPAGTYSVIITGSSGALAHTAVLTLTVQ